MTLLLQNPGIQGWLLFVMAACLIVIAVCSLLGVGFIANTARQLDQRASLSEKLQPLLDRGDLDEVLTLARERLRAFPDDVAAHYYSGVVLQRRGDLKQALVHLRRVPQLQAGWDIDPMIAAVEKRLEAQGPNPELRVVPVRTEGTVGPVPKTDA